MLVVNRKPKLITIIDGRQYGALTVFDPESNLETSLRGRMYALYHIINACTKVERASDGKEVLCLENYTIITDEKGNLIVVSTLNR